MKIGKATISIKGKDGIWKPLGETKSLRVECLPMVADPGCCEEAALISTFCYIPCNKTAISIVGWKGRPDNPIRMCAMCTDHNVRNRGGEIIGPYKE